MINTALPVCTGTPSDNIVGFTCRANATSPITLTQNAVGVRAGLSLMGIAYSGSSSTGTSNFIALLSADFTQPGETTISSTWASSSGSKR
ncbi:MAG: hypothetical protein JOZ62_08540 [Acidobacteriaceae bacterium]|nr:hypothetical protein [Acidobacteriaceae bacterium]